MSVQSPISSTEKFHILDERIAFTSTGCGVLMQIYEIQLPKWFEDLFDV